MQVPVDNNPEGQGVVGRIGPKPSETELLMALGTMHSLGRFKVAEQEKMPFIDTDQVMKQGGGTPAEWYWALTRKMGKSPDEAREMIDNMKEAPPEDIPAEVQEKYRGMSPRKPGESGS